MILRIITLLVCTNTAPKKNSAPKISAGDGDGILRRRALVGVTNENTTVGRYRVIDRITFEGIHVGFYLPTFGNNS